MNILKTPLAALRVALIALALCLTTLLVLLVALVPIRIGRGVRLTYYPINWFTRFFIWVLGIRYTCTDPELLRSHNGLIVCNHLSYVDVMMLMRTAPSRFMSTVGVRQIPLIGWVAVAVDTIFVHRGDKESRASAREELGQHLQQHSYPPLTLFPEGRIGDGTQVNEFRYGAFEVATDQQVDTLACALHYVPHHLVDWTDPSETLPQAIWRLASAERPLHATLIPISILKHHRYETPAQMSIDAHAMITNAIRASHTRTVRQ